MKRKQGISLIVLVITIIVMVVLVAAVVVSLNNTGIINKANQAVSDADLAEVKQIATLTWAEEFMLGKRGDVLKTDVLERLKEYTDKYKITVTDNGIFVSLKGQEVDYFTYEYDTVNMTATLVGVKEDYREDAYYLHSGATQSGEPFASAIIDENGNTKTDIVIPSTTKGTDGKTYTVSTVASGAFAPIKSYHSGYLVVTQKGKYTTMVIPSTVNKIDEGAFSKCEKLTSVVIPKSVIEIGDYAFWDCTLLTDVYYTGTEAEWNAISKGYYNKSLTNATIHYNYVISE